MKCEISGRAIVGSKEPQQDTWCVVNARGESLTGQASAGAVQAGDGTLVVVADGIGGYSGGEVASKLACEAFAKEFVEAMGTANERLQSGLNAANSAIAQEKRRNANLQDMGCTLIAVYLDGGRMTFVSVGDSLLLRSRDEEIHRVNLDHSYFEFLDRQVLGSDDPERWALAVHDTRRRASLTLAVTGGPLNSAEFGHQPQIAARPLLAGDVLIVATDGIETLDLVQLQNFMRLLRPQGIEAIANGLIKAVNGIGKTRSYQDNTTIVVIAVPGSASPTRILVPAGMQDIANAARRVSALTKARVVVAAVVLCGIAALAAAGLMMFGRAFLPMDRTPPAPIAAPGASPTTDPQTARLRREDTPLQPSAGDLGASEPPPSAPTSQPAQGEARAEDGRNSSRGREPPRGPAPQADPGAASPGPNANAVPEGGAADPKPRPPAPVPPLTIFQVPDSVLRGVRLVTLPVENAAKCFNNCLNEPKCDGYTFHLDRRCDLFSRVQGHPSPERMITRERGAVSGYKMWSRPSAESGAETVPRH